MEEKIKPLDEYAYAHFLMYDVCPFCGLSMKFSDYLNNILHPSNRKIFSLNKDELLICKNSLTIESGFEKVLFCKKCFRTFKFYQTKELILGYEILGQGEKK